MCSPQNRSLARNGGDRLGPQWIADGRQRTSDRGPNVRFQGPAQILGCASDRRSFRRSGDASLVTTQIYEGTNQVQRVVMSKQLLKGSN
jgi:hypothetical protein